MTTFNQIAFQVAEAAGRADDHTFLERVRNGIHYYRAMLIRQDFERTGRTPAQLLQSIAVDLVDASPADVCVTGLECTVRRSSRKVPVAVRHKGGRSPYRYVGTVIGTEPFLYENYSALPLVAGNAFTKHLPRYTQSDEYLYFLNVPYDKVLIRDVFADPSELAAFKDCDGTACFDPDAAYPIAADMVPRLIQAMLGGEFGTRALSEELKHGIETSNHQAPPMAQ